MSWSCKLNTMLNWGLPSSIHSPICCSSSSRSKEAYPEPTRLSSLIIFGPESERPYRDPFRLRTCTSSLPQTSENDFSGTESTQACKASHFRLLMENINVLDDRIADSNVMKLERDILVHLERLGALALFHACLSRTVAYPSTYEITQDPQVRKKIDDGVTKTVVPSMRKRERKTSRQNGFKRVEKQEGSRLMYGSSDPDLMQPMVSLSRKKTKAIGRRAAFTKNEAEMARAVKVVAGLERIKATMERETGGAMSSSRWAEAAGIDEKVLHHTLHYGWHCRDELLQSSRSLVVFIARNYRGLGVAYDDILQAGKIGVLQGAERFDHTRGYQFSTYVQFWIRKSISTLVSRHSRGIKIPVTLSTAMNRVQKARKALRRTRHGKYPDDEELAKLTGFSLHKVQSANKCLRVVGSVNRDCLDCKSMESTPDTNLEIPEKLVMRKHMRNDITSLLRGLDPKLRLVLELRYGFTGQCKSLGEIGSILRVSKEWIRRMEARALSKLRLGPNQRNFGPYLDS